MSATGDGADGRPPDSDSDSEDGSDVDPLETAYFPFGDTLPTCPNDGATDEEARAPDLEPPYESVDAGAAGPSPLPYVAKFSGLLPGISSRLERASDALAICGGMDDAFFSACADASNGRGRSVAAGNFGGWQDVSVAEMRRWFGILLKISIDGRQLDGYGSYFEETSIRLHADYAVRLSGGAWAKGLMTLDRFHQIRAAFRPPVSGTQGVCGRLSALGRLNDAAKHSFICSSQVIYDDGGAAVGSVFSPLQSFNEGRCGNSRMEFSVLTDAKYRYAYYTDVCYRGDGGRDEMVVNSVVSSGIAKSGECRCQLFCDSRYASSHLFITLDSKYNVKATGPCNVDIKNFPKQLLECDAQGPLKILQDKSHNIIFFRLCEGSRSPLNFISTLGLSSLRTIQQKPRNKAVDSKYPECLIEYRRYIERNESTERNRAIIGGWLKKTHFRKWYKRAFFGICDIMLHNAFVAWNISSNEQIGSIAVSKIIFFSAMAEELIHYPIKSSHSSTTISNPRVPNTTNIKEDLVGHKLIAPTTNKRTYCAVCRLEEMWKKNQSKSEKAKYGTGSRAKRFMMECRECGISLHALPPKSSDHFIHNMDEFRGKSCFEIFHSPLANGLWCLKKGAGNKAYTVQTSHHIYIEIRNKHGLERKKRPREDEDTGGHRIEEKQNVVENHVIAKVETTRGFLSRATGIDCDHPSNDSNSSRIVLNKIAAVCTNNTQTQDRINDITQQPSQSIGDDIILM